MSYTTFNGLYQSESEYTFQPQSLNQLTSIIQDYLGLPVRVSGSHHTFNDISLTRGITLRTDHLNKILEINPDKLTITVESGIITKDINSTLGEYGLALPIQSAISLQSAGGIISTGTHGSDITHGSFCNHSLEYNYGSCGWIGPVLR